MTQEEIQAALDEIGKSLREQFPDAADRLAQLEAHISTAAMVVGHIFDEAARAAGGQ